MFQLFDCPHHNISFIGSTSCITSKPTSGLSFMVPSASSISVKVFCSIRFLFSLITSTCRVDFCRIRFLEWLSTSSCFRRRLLFTLTSLSACCCNCEKSKATSLPTKILHKFLVAVHLGKIVILMVQL